MMPDKKLRSEDNIAGFLRQQEPYHYERVRQHSNYPRPAQANISQPNQVSLQGWAGMSTRGYWNGVFRDYLRRRKASPETNLALGRLR